MGRPDSILASPDWLPNGTIGYDPSPAVARDEIKTFLPSSHHPSTLAVTDGLAGITTRRRVFTPPLMFGRENGFSADVCMLAGFTL